MRIFVHSLFVMVLLSTFVQAQNASMLWQRTDNNSVSDLPKVRRNSFPTQAYYYKLNLHQLQQQLINAPVRGQFNGLSNVIIEFPNANGGFEQFRVMESPIMHPDLAAKYPMIKTYCAQGIDDPTATMRFSITQFGLHTMTISGKTSTYYTDPYTTDLQYYIVYNKKSLHGTQQSFECLTEDNIDLLSLRSGPSAGQVHNTDDQKLRKFRLAQSCTAEYGNIFAGSSNQVANIQAQMAITINRVNGVYERDLAITLEFVPNNDLLIYYGNTNSDPWNNEWNTKTAQTIDAAIGVNNYDIGHNFNTSGGGNAGCISCVCTSTSQNNQHKGRGYTGSSNPTGDPFDIDYVAHEMGHQFGGYHIMNTCSRSGSGQTEVEPASGSSIMGYAGICSSNVQAHSDDDFNYVNIRDLSDNIQAGNSTCATFTVLTNQPPTANAGPDYTIPKSTAYVLEGIGNDPDGNASLTYSWSQNDPQQSPGNGAPQATYSVGPLYRALSPSTSPNRYMPNMLTLLGNNLSNTWEVTPSVARTMNFSFVVRDNDVNGGQTASDLMKITVTGNAGPFVVTSQNTPVSWNAGTSQTITWDVAGTTANPVNCSNVNIYLSTDSGYTYPVILASNVPNNGSATITVPSVSTSFGRVMVRGAGNVFFDLNDAFINIQSSEFTLNMSNNNQSVCPPDNIIYNFTYNTYLGFNEPTTFSASGNPAGSTVTFNPATVVNNGTPVQMTISGLTPAMFGTYNITITGTSATVTQNISATLTVLNPNPAPATLLMPVNGSIENTNTVLTWSYLVNSGIMFDLEVATDASFLNIVLTANALTSTNYAINGLLSSTSYYWRVKAYSSCGASSFSPANYFVTNSCSSDMSIDVPKGIPNNQVTTISSTLASLNSGVITDVNVVNLIGTHTYIWDLTMKVKSPQGTEVSLITQICGNENNFNINFDDSASNDYNTIPCPPTDGNTYKPQSPLSVFNGEDANGTWTLSVTDNYNSDGGSLTSWGLEICTSTAVGIQKSYISPDVSVYPNPANDVFNVNITNINHKISLNVYNNLGQIIKDVFIEKPGLYQVDLSNQSSGIYYINIIGGGHNYSQKLILINNK
ncbi:MAG: proprotein convertase P-domain-containing protein [Bacteroidia bacterium]|nr:proprotein convertase P-domain-containing protein [Bacteroidia bacterium]